MIEHVARTDHFLKESRRVLRPGGQLVHSTNNLASWHNVVALMLGWQPGSRRRSATRSWWATRLSPSASSGQAARRIFGLFTGRALHDLAVHHGLHVRSVKGVGYYPFTGGAARFSAGSTVGMRRFLLLYATRD